MIEADDRSYSDYVRVWKNRMNEPYNIATINTLSWRDRDKTHILKATVQPLELEMGISKEFNPKRRYRKA